MVVQSEFRQESLQGQDANDKRQRLRQRFEVIKKLGQGTYGKVQLAINKETNGEVAIKTIKKAKIENEQDLVRIRREIQIMASIQHPHIIHIYEVFENSEKIVLVMQYASGGELYDYLGCHRKLPEKEARRIFRQIAAAIYYCHKNKICHRDLKLENILLDDKGNAKIADFGLSNLFDERKKLRTFCGSPLYASPEIVKGTPYCGPEVDCWSLGVLLYTLVYGAMPFDGRNFKRLVKQISEGDYYEPSMKSKASGIIRRLLTVDVNSRATIKDICLDDWVNDGYDHSLFKLANDMADLTPVASSYAFASSVSNAKDANIQGLGTPTKHHQKNEDITYRTFKRNDDFQTKKVTLSDSPLNNISKITNTANEITATESNTVPCEVRFVMGSILTSVEEMVQKSRLISSSKDTKHSKDHILNETGSQIIVSIESMSEKKVNDIDENITENLNQKSSLETPMKNDNDDKGIDSFTNEEEPKHYEKNEPTSSRNLSGVLLRKEMSQNKIKENKREHIKTWNVSIDQAKHTQKEADSILPIFDVTSVIPKRPNRKSSMGSQEHLIQNGDDINQTIEKAIPADSNNGKNSRKHSKSNDVKTPPTSTQRTETSDKIEKSESVFSSLSKHRNDVIDYINNIFSRHKLSTQIVRHTELNVKENNSENKVMQAETMRDSNHNTQTIHERVQQVLNADISKQKNETNDTNADNMTLMEQKSLTSELSAAGELSPEKAENCKPMESYENKQQHICHQSDISEKSINAESNVINKFTHPDELKSSGTIAKASEINAETMNSEIKCLDGDKSFCHGSNYFLEKISSPHSTPNLPENNNENVLHNRRISLRDTVKIDVNENGKSKQGNYKKRLKNRSYSVGNNEKVNDLEKILRRPRKYSLCALLAASFEFEQMAARQTRKDSDTLKKIPGKVEIPKSFDPASESDSQTPIDKREFILIPSISVAENKQKMENEIEKVKLSALSMMRRQSETGSRRKIKNYTRSCTDILQRMGDVNGDAFNLLQNYNEYDLTQLNGSVDYLVDEHFKFERELNFPNDQWDAENFEYSQPLLVQGNESYVPISRCCKKINFPPKAQQNGEKTIQIGETENAVFTLDQYSKIAGDTNGINGNVECTYHSNSPSKKLKKKNKSSQSSINDKSKSESKLKQNDEGNTEEDEDNKSIGQSESIYSSSIEKDSSDNDDDLDDIFGTKLDAQGSEDLWQFLKSVNSDISNHLKRIKHNKSLCSRSKSQECKASVDCKTYEKLLTRSRSKEEKQNSPPIRPGPPESLKDSCYCSLASDFTQTHSSCTHMDKEQSDFSISMKNSQSLDEEFGSTERDINFDTHSHLSGSLKEKYYSLSNLEDPRSFLYPQILSENYERQKCKSWATVPDLDEGIEFLQKDGDMSPARARRLALYNTMRLHKSKRSQSQTIIKPDNNVQRTEKETTSKSNRKVFHTDKEHSNSLRNKALSDFNISSKELPYDLGSLDNLINYDISSRNSQRFCKSLGSKLNLESLNFSSDLLSKKSHKIKENCHKKRERKVSFLDVSKSKNSNFGLESVAKAQKVLNSIDREVDTSLPEETGTLLEALKTQGYKSLISQRLQESESSEGPINRRYSWACMGNIANMFPDSFSTLASGKGNFNLEDYTRFLQWNRKTFGTVDDVNYGSEMLDEDVDMHDNTNMLNILYGNTNYQKTDINWKTPPSTWLYQNLNNFRSSHTSDDFIPQDWDNSVLYPSYNEVHDYEIPDLSNDRLFHDGKLGKNKHKATHGHDDHVPTFNEAGLQTKSANSIEKLSMKIKALKSRCNQKSFEELSCSRDQLSEPVLGRETEQKRYSSPPDHTDNQDSGDSRESVSDRIWRKSFYSRFNDIPTIRRRRSTMMESDFSIDSFATKLPKHHVNEEHLTDGLNTEGKELTSSLLNERIGRKLADDDVKKVDRKKLLVKENDQHIPYHATSEEQIDQIEDR